MRILYCGSGWFPVIDAIAERLPEGLSITRWDREVPLAEAVRDVQVILPSNAPISAAVVSAPGDLRLIQQPAAGVDNIDLVAAAQRGVPVCNAPGLNHVAVAEAALFLMLALARRWPRARRAFDEGRIGAPAGVELWGKVLGIIGMGQSGTALAERARGLGMEVAPVRSSSTRAELMAVLAGSDVVSLHCPLTPETRGLIGAEALAAMKPGALLVNCARGPIIDRDALEAALDQGRLGGVGLDTFWHEPWDPTDALYARDEVVVLPHVAGSTAESFARIADLVVENINRVASGRALLHQVA